MATPQSQLCKEESWERVYYPPDLDPLRPPTTQCKEKFFTSILDRIHAVYGDIRDRYIARYSLFKERRNCSCKSIYQKHFIWRKAIALILLVNALFSTAVYGITTDLLQFVLGPKYTLMPVVIASGTAQILFPIIGHISDTYVCRHKVLQFSMWSAWVSFAVLGVTLSLDSWKEGLNAINQYAILPTSFVVITISLVCFMANVIPFALDQMQGASHVHYSSFFYWWYLTLNIGSIGAYHTPEYCTDKPGLRFLIQVEIALLCVTIALILDVLFEHWLVIEPHNSKPKNIIVQICQVLCYVLKPPGNQRVPSSVQHELDLSSCNRLQLAKRRFGGKFETEQVENTRTFFYVVSVIISVGFILVPLFGVYNTLNLMESHMKGNISRLAIHWKVCNFEISVLSASRPALLLILIPVLDLLLVPLLRHAMLHPTILKRLGIGSMCTILSVFSVLALEGVGDRYYSAESDICMFNHRMYGRQGRNETSSYWLFLPMILATIAEIFIYIPGFEFMSAQAPYNMRGLLIGIFFSAQGFFSLISLSIQHLFSWRPIYTLKASTGYTCGFWYYLLLACLAVLGMCCFLVVACKYRRRKRGDMFNQVGMIEEYFSTGRIHSSRWT